jgi:hypothetical protein
VGEWKGDSMSDTILLRDTIRYLKEAMENIEIISLHVTNKRTFYALDRSREELDRILYRLENPELRKTLI